MFAQAGQLVLALGSMRWPEGEKPTQIRNRTVDGHDGGL
jgi:hypothetical protein